MLLRNLEGFLFSTLSNAPDSKIKQFYESRLNKLLKSVYILYLNIGIAVLSCVLPVRLIKNNRNSGENHLVLI